MDKVTNELMYETIKEIHHRQKQHSEEFRKAHSRLESIDLHMAAFHVTVSHQQEEIADLQARLEIIEKRLELID